MSSRDRPDDLAAKLATAIDRLGRAQRLHRQALATRHGLTPLQVDLLTVLSDGPPPEPVVGMLADELGVAQPTATDSLGALADKGLVARRRDPADRRRWTIELTDAGQQRVADLAVPHDDPLTAVVGSLPSEVQEATLDTLLAMIASMVEIGAITVARTCFTCRFHRQDGPLHRCDLLDRDLLPSSLRVNCPDHAAA